MARRRKPSWGRSFGGLGMVHPRIGSLRRTLVSSVLRGDSAVDQQGLVRGSAMNASAGADSGRIMAWQWPDTSSIKQNECLPISRSAIESSERPTAIVGQSLSGESRPEGVLI